MRELILFVLFAACIHSIHAQTYGEKGFLHDIHLELPQVEAKYSIPLKNKKFLALPYGMDTYLYPIQSSFSPMVRNFTVRIIAAYYKDKIGLEFYFEGFGGDVDMTAYHRYMAAQFPHYYYTTGPSNSSIFYGPAVGIAYRIHWGSFIVEPKFILGYEKQDTVFPNYSSTFKERGSNQFINYTVRQTNTPSHQYSLHPRLQIGRRFHFKDKPTEFEAGAVGDFFYSPYSFRTDITQQPYGASPVTRSMNVSSTYRQFNIGMYFKVYLHKWLY